MASLKLRDRVKQGLFVLDGAMGTQLMAAGVETGKCNDYLNISSAEVVSGIHAAYFQAGSDGVIANTFGANRYVLARHGHQDKVKEINSAAAEIAVKTAGEGKYVLGDVGPCGDFLEPVGAVKPDELKAAFTEQAKALVDGGVDGFIIETMTALDEAAIAVEAIRSVSDLPVFASLAYDSAGQAFKTMMGISPGDVVEKLSGCGVDAIGFNCGTLNMEQYIQLTEIYAAALAGTDILLLAEPNAGRPELIDGRAVYNLSPEEFAEAAEKIYAAGAVIIGGCCGTSPAHIKALAEKLKA